MTRLMIDQAMMDKLRAAGTGPIEWCDEKGRKVVTVADPKAGWPPPPPPDCEYDDDDWPSEEELDRRARGPSVPAAEVEAMLRKLRETHG